MNGIARIAITIISHCRCLRRSVIITLKANSRGGCPQPQIASLQPYRKLRWSAEDELHGKRQASRLSRQTGFPACRFLSPQARGLLGMTHDMLTYTEN